MTKQEFLEKLEASLDGLPKDDIAERISFYSEMIDDRIEEGLSEEDAVADIGSIDDIVFEMLKETSIAKLVKEKIKPNRKLKTWEIVLIWAGSPVWFPLLIAAAAVVFSLYVSVWAIIISFWAVFGASSASFVGGIAGSVILFTLGRALEGVAMIGASFVFAGLAIFAFFGCKCVTKSILKLTKKALLRIKKSFIKKEDAQ